MRRWASRALAALLAALTLGAGAEPRDLPAVREAGVIRVALYKDFPPYSAAGGGIDVEIAAALAGKLGVRLDPIWFQADENVDDDLRNMVWKGHYLGTGPADVMIHVPIDPGLARRNSRARFVAPYFRERLDLVHDLAATRELDDFAFLSSGYVGVEGASAASVAMLAYDGGRYRDRVKFFKTAEAAVAALRRGEIAAVLAPHVQAQAMVAGDSRFAVSEAPIRDGLGARQWVLGMAVKSGNEALAKAIEGAMSELVGEGEIARVFARHGVTHLKP